MNVTWSNSLGKICFLGLCGIKVLKVTYMLCLGKVFESLTNKIQSFQRFKNFRHFRVFVLCYRANSKSRKQRKTVNFAEPKAILLQCVFWNCWLCFLFERASLDMFCITFRRFRRFRRIELTWKLGILTRVRFTKRYSLDVLVMSTPTL